VDVVLLVFVGSVCFGGWWGFFLGGSGARGQCSKGPPGARLRERKEDQMPSNLHQGEVNVER